MACKIQTPGASFDLKQFHMFSSCSSPRTSNAHRKLKTGIWPTEFLSLTFGPDTSLSRPAAFFGGKGSSADQQNNIQREKILQEQINSAQVSPPTVESPSQQTEDDGDNLITVPEGLEEAELSSSDSVKGIELVSVLLEKTGKNKRRISVTIPIEASLEAVWNVLTDYEKMVEFLPGLAACEVQERWEDGARLFQIGQQNLALGLKFQARGVLNVHEHPVEILPDGIRRRIDFEMIEGDFQVFQGTWQMEQAVATTLETSEMPAAGSGIQTCLSYILDVQPKIWLPVALVEGRLRKEVQVNLVCVREQVLRCQASLHAC